MLYCCLWLCVCLRAYVCVCVRVSARECVSARMPDIADTHCARVCVLIVLYVLCSCERAWVCVGATAKHRPHALRTCICVFCVKVFVFAHVYARAGECRRKCQTSPTCTARARVFFVVCWCVVCWCVFRCACVCRRECQASPTRTTHVFLWFVRL